MPATTAQGHRRLGDRETNPVARAATPRATDTVPRAAHTETRPRATARQATTTAKGPRVIKAMISIGAARGSGEEPDLRRELRGERGDDGQVEEPRRRLHGLGAGASKGESDERHDQPGA